MATTDSTAAAATPPELREALRRAIAEGRYAPGVKLVERELTLAYGVGRTGVRDALRHLAAEGIVELTENRGARVCALDYAEAQEIYQVRSVLEGLAGELFAVRGTAAQKLAFSQSFAPLREALLEGEVTRALRASDEYYALLLGGCGNRELHSIVDRLHVRINQVRRVSISIDGRIGPTIDSLQRIVNAVLAGDPAEARAACIGHVKASAAATLPLLAASSRITASDPPRLSPAAD